MPKLSILQILAIIVFLIFYGFAVFAVTRDYYQRHPPQVAAVPATPHAAPSVAPRPAARVMAQDSAIPAAMVETNPTLLSQQADALFGDGRYAEAIPLYRRVLILKADDLDAYNDLGLALQYTGQTQAALDVLAEGTAKGPQFQRIWLTYGFVLAHSGDVAAATTTLTRARDLDPASDIGQEATRLLEAMQPGAAPTP
jgi:Flp pilus assembly protein TadD